MPEKKFLNEDLFYKGSSANLPRLHKNKVSFWDFKEFAVTIYIKYIGFGLVGLYGISTIVGYLMPNAFLYIYIKYIGFGLFGLMAYQLL